MTGPRNRETRLGGGDDYRLRAVSEARERMHEAEDRADKAEQQVKELQAALSDLLVHIPNGTATDPYKVKAYRVLAGSVEDQKPS